MGASDSNEPDFDDPDAFRRKYFVQMSHRGRAVRVLIALFLTLPGLIPMSWYGWSLALPLFGPAAVLLVYAGGDRRKRRGVLYCAVPTLLGLALALLSVVVSSRSVWSSGALPIVFGITLVTTLLAAFFGKPGE